jgi:hypothetical protein
MALKAIHAIVLVIAIVIVVGAAVALNMGGTTNDNDIDVKTSIVKGADATKMVVESNADILKNITSDKVTIVVTGLDPYVHSEWFDVNSFYTDLDATGQFNEQYGIMISSDAYELTGDKIKIDQDGKKKFSVEFQSPASKYCLYQLLFGKNTLSVDVDGAYLEEFVVPSGNMITPSLEIIGSYYEYQSDPLIEVTITDGSFANDILPEHIILDGAFWGLSVYSIDKISDNKIVINTAGLIPRCNGINGIISLTTEAYIGPSWYTEDRLAAEALIDYNTVIIDTFYIDFYDEYNLSVPVYFSQSYYDTLMTGELAIGALGTSETVDVSITGVDVISDDTFIGYFGYLVVPIDILFVEEHATLVLYSDGEQVTDLTTYSDSVMAFVYDVSADGSKCKVCIVPLLMDFAPGVTADAFTFPDGYKVDSFKIEDGVAYFEVSINELNDSSMYFINVEEGVFIDILGGFSEDMVLCIFNEDASLVDGTTLYSLGAEPTTDDMIKYLYGAQRFTDIYSMVELGVGVLSSILEATGAIEIPDPEQMRFEMLMLQCERIQIMLADINAKLDKVSNQIMKLDEKLDKVQMTQLKNQYSEYVKAVNNLENTSALLSKHLKTRIYNEVINGSGNFYIYLIENNKTSNKSDIFSIKHGDYSKDNTGGVIGDQKVLKTVALPIGAGTFKTASQLSKYVDGKTDKPGTTAYCMLKDLTDYYTANPIDGYTAENLAKGTYKAIIYKLLELATAQEGGDGDKMINAYKEFASVTASLHNGVYDPNIVNNYHAGIEYIEYKYNFYSETKDILRTMNYSAAMNVFLYGAFVNALDQISVSPDDTLPKFMDAGIKYLKDNTGVRNSDKYCYVAHGNIDKQQMTIHSDATFASKDKFQTHVYENLKANSHSNTLGNSRYVNTDMIQKINQRWESLGSPESTLSKYIAKYTGIQLGSYLMTKFEGEGDFSAADALYLQSAKNNIVTKHGDYQIIPCAKWFTLTNSFSDIKTYSESFDKNIKSKFLYKGEVLNLSNLTPVKVGGKENCLYAGASLIDHRSTFKYDEATLFSSWGYYDNDNFGFSWVSVDKGDGMKYYHETKLDYLRIT